MFYTDQMSTSKSLSRIVEIRHFRIAHPTLVTSRNSAEELLNFNFVLAITVVPRESEKSASHNFSFLFSFFFVGERSVKQGESPKQ